jgi:hypothetical protein
METTKQNKSELMGLRRRECYPVTETMTLRILIDIKELLIEAKHREVHHES